MSKEKMTPEKIKELTDYINFGNELKTLKALSGVNQAQIEAIDYFTKGIPEMREASIHFDKVGMAHTLDTDVFESVIVDGQNVLVKPSEQS